MDNERKMAETKEERFIRLGNDRFSKAIDAIENMQSLSNTASYSYDDDQVELLCEGLEAAVDELRKCFANGGVKKKKRGVL